MVDGVDMAEDDSGITQKIRRAARQAEGGGSLKWSWV